METKTIYERHVAHMEVEYCVSKIDGFLCLMTERYY